MDPELIGQRCTVCFTVPRPEDPVRFSGAIMPGRHIRVFVPSEATPTHLVGVDIFTGVTLMLSWDHVEYVEPYTKDKIFTPVWEHQLTFEDLDE